MVLIPPDAAIRMRMQTEANLLQPIHPVHEVPADLPELRPGQVFNARIQEALPENTYRALVAGKQITLQLPEGAKTGDQLELVVIDRSARVVIARQVDTPQSAGDAAAHYPFAKFTPAARLIGQLLPAEGEAAPPAPLNRGQPLVAQPPQTATAAAQLAPILQKAVAQSGMFYEAHQTQWVTGKLPLAQLLQEPQGQRSQPVAFQFAAAELVARAITTPERPVTALEVMQALATQPTLPAQTLQASAKNVEVLAQDMLQTLMANNIKVGAGTAAPIAPSATATATETTGSGQPASAQPAVPAPQPVPEELRPLVQQQLDAAASQRMVWHGEVWPQQSMDWEIDWDSEREADGRNEEDARWRTTLALTTPRLGHVEAQLHLSAQGVSIAIVTPYGASAADLRDEAPQLAEALAAAGVPLQTFTVRHQDEHAAGQ